MKEEKISLADLRKEYTDRNIPYARLLYTQEWAEAREQIVDRDGGFCSSCGRGETIGGRKGDYFGFGLKLIEVLAGWKKEMIEVEELYSSEKPYHLEVHHKYYVHNKYPWQYPEEALVTLCNWCHNELHQKTVVPYYSSEGQALGYTPCSRCYGIGRLPEYSHVDDGVCFRCAGARYDELIGK
jgi:hypothetical protein